MRGLRSRARALAAGAALAAAAAVAPAVGLPTTNLTAVNRAAWRAEVKWPRACEADFRATGFGAGLRLRPLRPRVTLVAVTCAMGAYQGTTYFAIRDTTGPRPAVRALLFRQYGERANGRVTWARTSTPLGIDTLDARRSRLTILAKSRGLGDCGVLTTYDIAARPVRVVAARAKLRCDGKPPFDPRNWPAVAPPGR